MKKFIVFVLILVVSVSLGATVFYFMRDNEELVIDCAPSIYVNKDEHFQIEAELKNAKIGNEIIMTSLHPSVLEFNPALGFEAKTGGAAIIEIKTKKGNIPAVYVEVTVGDGSELAPWYIDSEEDLLAIGSGEFDSADNYILMQDISFTSAITPILNTSEFKGSLNGNGYLIKDLTITGGQDVKNAGLFAQIGDSGIVTNLNVSNININGQFENAGTIAGVNLGTINRCNVENGKVTSTLENSNVGGITGTTKYSHSNKGRIDRCFSSISVEGTLNVGGLTGVNEAGVIINSYVSLKNSDSIKAITNGAIVGGLVGTNKEYNGQNSTIKNCYSLATVLAGEGLELDTIKLASLVGFNDEISKERPNYLMGIYAENSSLPLVNNEFELSFTAEQVAKKANYRGFYNSFPKDVNNKIIANEMKSYVGQKLGNQTYDVYWDFNNVWMLNSSINNGYPVLNKNGANVPDDISVAYDPSVISDAEDLIRLAAAVNAGTATEKYYILDADITLTGDFTPIGTKKYPFNGTFEGNGHKIIGLNISSSIIEEMSSNGKYVGLFGRISTIATVRNLILEDITISNGATYAGGIVGYNEGTIQNCKIQNSQQVVNKEIDNISATYAVGGITGQNLGLIENCKVVNQTIVTKALSSGASRYNGGITGINGLENNASKAIVRNSSVVESYCYDNEQRTSYSSDAEYSSDNDRNVLMHDVNHAVKKVVYYVAGISGANYYEITSNYVYKTDLKTNKFAHKGAVSGIVGYSKSASLRNQKLPEVTYNKVLYGSFEGFTVAGLINKQYGIVKYNDIQADTMIGTTVAGLVNTIHLNARLSNCFVKTYIVGNSFGQVAGMNNVLEYSAGFVDRWFGGSDEVYGSMSQIFSACTFNSSNAWSNYDSNAAYRRGTWIYSNREHGFASELIWEETGFAECQNAKDLWTHVHDITGISSEQAKLMINQDSTIALFTNYGFDLDAWEFNTMNYPSLKGLPQIIETETA